MASIQALFIDMDQTLARDSRSSRLSLERAFPLVAEHAPQIEREALMKVYREVNTHHWEDFDHSPISQLESGLAVRQLIWREALQQFGVDNERLTARAAALFQQAREETYVLYDDVIPALERLKPDFPLVLVTNGHSEIQRKKIEITGLDAWMDAIVVAQEAGCSKPKPEIFLQALQPFNIAPENVLMIGDHPEKDIQGGRQTGMQTAWMRRLDSRRPKQEAEADFVIESLEALFALLPQYHA